MDASSTEEIIDVVGDMSKDDTFSSSSSVISEKENSNSIEQEQNSAERKYFCQRCLNHGFEHPRKGHKPHCQYAKCECKDCSMVERRRQLNNRLSKCNPAVMKTEVVNGKKSRIPCCSRCACHGLVNPLKGHKKALCPFRDCKCEVCAMVVLRRDCMAAQVKLRRGQSKYKTLYMVSPNGDISDDCVTIPLLMSKNSSGRGNTKTKTKKAVLGSAGLTTQLTRDSPSPPALSPSYSISTLSSNATSPIPSPLLQSEFVMPKTNVTNTVTSVNTAALPAGLIVPTPITPVSPLINNMLVPSPNIASLATGLPAPRPIKPMYLGEMGYDIHDQIKQLTLQYNVFQIENIWAQLRFHNGLSITPHSN